MPLLSDICVVQFTVSKADGWDVVFDTPNLTFCIADQKDPRKLNKNRPTSLYLNAILTTCHH